MEEGRKEGMVFIIGRFSLAVSRWECLTASVSVCVCRQPGSKSTVSL